MTGDLRIGASGWHYDHWKGVFYPKDLPSDRWLEFYGERFDTAEINNTFYNLPAASTIEHWRLQSPGGFLFAVKASRLITHMKKLKDCAKPLEAFLDRVRELRHKLGPILFQLPPHWRADAGRLDGFVRLLPPRRRYAFEFRDPSWREDEDVLEVLRRRNASHCIYHMAGDTTPLIVTADWVYVRLHGPSGEYGGSYTRRQLRTWAERIGGWRGEGRDVLVYFNNDLDGHAVRNAATLRDLT